MFEAQKHNLANNTTHEEALQLIFIKCGNTNIILTLAALVNMKVLGTYKLINIFPVPHVKFQNCHFMVPSHG